MNERSVNGTLIMVLGIVSIFILQIPLGPIAWIMANGALQALNQGGGDASQRQQVEIGRICGIIGTALGVLGILWLLFVGVIGALFFGAARTEVPITVPGGF